MAPELALNAQIRAGISGGDAFALKRRYRQTYDDDYSMSAKNKAHRQMYKPDFDIGERNWRNCTFVLPLPLRPLIFNGVPNGI